MGWSLFPIGTTHSKRLCSLTTPLCSFLLLHSGQVGGLLFLILRLALGSRRIDELLRALRSSAATTEQLALEAAEAADSSGVVSFDATSVDTPEPDGRSRRLVTGLTLQVTPGQNVLVTGPNGCGKTSLFRVLAGLWQPVGGAVHCPRDHLMWYVSSLAKHPPGC